MKHGCNGNLSVVENGYSPVDPESRGSKFQGLVWKGTCLKWKKFSVPSSSAVGGFHCSNKWAKKNAKFCSSTNWVTVTVEMCSAG